MYIYLGKKYSTFVDKQGNTVSGYNLFFARQYSVSGKPDETSYIPLRRSIWVSESMFNHIDLPSPLNACEPVFNEYGRLVCVDPCDDE